METKFTDKEWQLREAALAAAKESRYKDLESLITQLNTIPGWYAQLSPEGRFTMPMGVGNQNVPYGAEEAADELVRGGYDSRRILLFTFITAAALI